jgi:hypothetical protein
VYLTSFAHREDLFQIAERWFCGRPEKRDALRLTEILICDGFILGETLDTLAVSALAAVHDKPFHKKRINLKGELRDAICAGNVEMTPRAEELIRLYRKNPDYYYRETPINGVMCLDEKERLLGLYRIKRPRRIAEKANRKIANWIFRLVQNRAQEMAQNRAREAGIPLEHLVSPQEVMRREFMDAEADIARAFSEGLIRFDRDSITLNDVGGMKIIATQEKLSRLESALAVNPKVRIIEKETFHGRYQATNLLLDVLWDVDRVCRRYEESRGWEKYRKRGIPEDRLKKEFPSFLQGGDPTVCIEVILSTYPDMVESELGNCIHEKRMMAQRENWLYKGNISMNVEFLLEYLFAVGFSPRVDIDRIPFKLWGRYLPDSLAYQIRRLYGLSGLDLFY